MTFRRFNETMKKLNKDLDLLFRIGKHSQIPARALEDESLAGNSVSVFFVD